MIRLYQDGTDLTERYGLQFEDDCVLEQSVMGEPCLFLHFFHEGMIEDLDDAWHPVHVYCGTELTEEQILAAGDMDAFFRLCYYPRRPAEIVVHNDSLYEFKLNLYPVAGRLSDEGFIDVVKNGDVYVPNLPIGEFSVTGTPYDHLAKVITCLNSKGRVVRVGRTGEDYPQIVWKAGTCMTSGDKAISYTNVSVFEALNLIAQTFDTEWYIDGTTISIGDVRLNSDAPLSLEYGQGKGLVSGVTRGIGGDAIQRMWVTGTERNVNKKDYGAARLLLPYPEYRPYPSPSGMERWIPAGHILFDGEHIDLDAEFDWNHIVDRFYVDVDRVSLSSFVDGGMEAFWSNDDVYPSKELTATAVMWEYKGYYGDLAGLRAAYPELEDTDSDAWDNVKVDIVAAGNDVDYDAYKRKGEVMQLVFQSGELAGKEFPVFLYAHEARGRKPARRFEIERTGIDGYNMPIPPYVPFGSPRGGGDKFAIFNVDMPTEYYRSAQIDLLRAACKYLYQNNAERFAVSAMLDGVYASRNWEVIKDKIVLNGKVIVSVADTEYSLRISKMTTHLNRPHAPEVEFSNDYVKRRASTRRAIEITRSSSASAVAGEANRRANTARSIAENGRSENVVNIASANDMFINEGDTYITDPVNFPRTRHAYVYVPRRAGQRFTIVKTGVGSLEVRCVDSTAGITFTGAGSDTAATAITIASGRYDFVWTGSTWMITRISF